MRELGATHNKQELSVLIVDDEEELRKSLASILSSSMLNYDCKTSQADCGEAALAKVANKSFDLVLMDVKMPGLSGLEVLEKIKEAHPQTFVVIMTAHGNLQDAITAIKSGAYDYLEKPVQPDKLKELVKKALETQEMVSSLLIARPILDEDTETEFVGHSKKMTEVFGLVNRLSQVDTTVLIRGENGTGKELVAKAIHFNSPRKHGAFLAINCGAIPEELIESQLFGHERGAFTGANERKIGLFQVANKGTLFLDEIGELKPELQVKLLRVLQEKRFIPVGGNREIKTNARILAATNQNLEKMIEESHFREDLFYRLNVMTIFMPPLRERIDDLESLVTHFIRKHIKDGRADISGLHPEAMELLKEYHWPGNIRELENAIQRALVVENSTVIQKESLPGVIAEAVSRSVRLDLPKFYIGPLDFDRFKEETEKEFIMSALKANRGRINKTVAQANIPKNTLLRKIKKYEIEVAQFHD